jgi:hypothetical protein
VKYYERLALALFLMTPWCGCDRSERPIAPVLAPVDAGPAPFGDIYVAPSNAVRFEMHGPDFEDARGRGCPLEAIVEQRADGQVLRFRCAVYGGP